MSAAQLRLIPDPTPLVERLGREFFWRLPERPGVYLMHQATAVLYVGKAKNLRHRLGSYRVANPDRMPRRTLRLLRQVERITWEECADESSALLRESELLLSLKLRFNRAGVWRGPDRFLCWRATDDGIELAVTEVALAGWCLQGPKGSSLVHLHRALVRLLWCRLQTERGFFGMPSGWGSGRHGAFVSIPEASMATKAEVVRLLDSLTKGNVEPLQNWLSPTRSTAEKVLRDEDMELVARLCEGRGASAHR